MIVAEAGDPIMKDVMCSLPQCHKTMSPDSAEERVRILKLLPTYSLQIFLERLQGDTSSEGSDLQLLTLGKQFYPQVTKVFLLEWIRKSSREMMHILILFYIHYVAETHSWNISISP